MNWFLRAINLPSGITLQPPTKNFPKAREAALKALAIDDSLAEAHTSLAFVRALFDWDWPGAETEYRKAIALNPNYVAAHHWYALLLGYALLF